MRSLVNKLEKPTLWSELSITHKRMVIIGRLGMEQLPIIGDIGQPLKSAPENLDAGFAIAFAPEEAAQLCHPAHGLTQGGRMFRQGQRVVSLTVQALPFVLLERDRARHTVVFPPASD